MIRRSILVIACLLLPLNVAAEVVNRIAAVVNNEVITTNELEGEMAAQGRATDRLEVLSRMIEEVLIRQRIVELQIRADDDEIEAAIRDIQRQNDLSREQLEEALQAEGISLTQYRQTLRDQILRYKLIGHEVQNKVEVSSQEIRDYFRENIDRFREMPNIHLSRMTFRISPRAGMTQVAEVRAMAEEALARLRQGEEFHAVLLSYTAGNKAEGGDMGSLPTRDLAPSFARAVGHLNAGEVSDLVETPDGFHLLRVEEKSDGRVRHFDSVKDDIRALLLEQKAEEGFRKWAQGLRANAYIEIRI
jgi:peptidyl-prolyl cis-trans isomerase SurA